MSNYNRGVGDEAQSKAFAKVLVGNSEMELIHGEHPHSRQDNTTYARDKYGHILDFSGHRLLFKIEVEEHNYLKQSHLSGDEIRKGGSVKVFNNGVLCYEGFCRSYESGFKQAQKFIDDMEEKWWWYPHDLSQWQGKTVGYKEQLCVIDRFIVDQGCMILKTPDGKPFKRFLWEDKEDYDKENYVKVEVTDPSITWYPKKD